MPLYIASAHDTAYSTTDTGKLFIYGLETALKQHQGCVVDKMEDAHLSLFINTVKLVGDGDGGNASIVSVALAVPLNGLPVYMDNYVLLIRDTDSVNGQVNGLLQNIGETLDKYTSRAQ